MDAPGVNYFEVAAGGQSVRLFRCERFKCELTPASCACRFASAQGLNDRSDVGYAFYDCKRCQIGAAHADATVNARPRQKRDCIRCGEWAFKLVKGLLCVSCFNRQREVLKGQDRRGRPPHAVIRFWDHEPAKLPHVVTAIYLFAVDVEGHGIKTYPATRPREALEMASRQFFKGQPLKLAVVNAAELGRSIPRYAVTRAA